MLSIICIQVALFLGQALGQVPRTRALPNLPIIGTSFTLSSRVTVDHDGTSAPKEAYEFHFEELYSLAQERTKIVYRTHKNDLIDELSLPETGTFHVTAAGNVLVVGSDRQSSERTSCKLSDRHTIKRLAQTILLEELHQDFTAELALPALGPASALFLLDKLKWEVREVQEFGQTARNVPAVMFAYSRQQTLNNTSKAQLFCLYAKTQLESQTAMPLRIIISVPQGPTVVYEFFHFQNFHNSAQLVEAVEGVDNIGSHVLLDPFAVERAIGCANSTLTLGVAQNPLQIPDWQTPFYFRAQITHPDGETQSATVAYAGALDMMRVDQMGTTLLMNLDLGHAYHVVERHSHQDSSSRSGRILELADSPESLCILFEIPTRSEIRKLGSVYDIDRLLVGVPGEKLVYLGRARVRGIWTQVYEAYGTSWPVWLEQPIQFTRSWARDDPKMRHSHELQPNSGLVLNTVIYLAEQPNSQLQSKTVGRLLLVEIFQLQTSDSSRAAKTTIEVYDFDWKLPAQSSAGCSSGECFSLANSCQASTKAESNHYARVDMRLGGQEHGTAQTLSQLEKVPTTLRNLAILESLHENLRVAPTLVYGLQSAFTMRQLDKETRTASLFVSFRLGSHREEVSRLRFYGRGRPKKMFQFKLLRFQTGFSECFHLAAHHHQDTFFAHSARNKLCLIDHNRHPRTLVKNSHYSMPTAFDLSTNGPMEVYFVNHSSAETLIQADPISSLNSKFRRAYSAAVAMRKFPISCPGGSTDCKSDEHSDFHIKSFHVRELDEKHSFRVDDAFVSDTNKFFDVALVADDSINKLVSPAAGAEHRMNFLACQTACLREANCQSFSICLAEARYQCTLSSADLRDSKVLLKLLDLSTNRQAEWGRAIAIQTDAVGNFSIKKQRNCELHAKTYLEMFHEPSRAVQMGKLATNWAPLIHQVEGREDCARICYRQTYDFLEQDVASSLKLKIGQLLESVSTYDKQQQVTMENELRQHRNRLRGLCSEFLFLDASAFTSLSKKLQELLRQASIYHRINGLLDDYPVNNYCIAGQRNLDDSQHSPLVNSSELRQVAFERFEFKFELLYERQQGVKISRSRMSTSELRAYEEVRLLQTFKSRQSLELMKSFLDRHENIQDSIAMSLWDESKCAMICTQQLRGLWPACKSFDMLIIATGNSVSAFCRLNSMTLREAQAHGRTDLLEHESSFEKVQVWHYEPRLSFVREELELEGKLEINQSVLDRRQLGNATTVVIVCLFGVIVGFLSGAEMGLRFVKTNQTERDESRDTSSLVRDETIDMNTFRKRG